MRLWTCRRERSVRPQGGYPYDSQMQTHPTPASLLTLAEYLELSLDFGGSLLIGLPRAGECSMYISNPFAPEQELQPCGTVEEMEVDEILRLTHVGMNQLEIEGQQYRFVRSSMRIARRSVVVFTPA